MFYCLEHAHPHEEEFRSLIPPGMHAWYYFRFLSTHKESLTPAPLRLAKVGKLLFCFYPPLPTSPPGPRRNSWQQIVQFL